MQSLLQVSTLSLQLMLCHLEHRVSVRMGRSVAQGRLWLDGSEVS